MNEQEQEAMQQEVVMMQIRSFWLEQLGLEIGAPVTILPLVGGGQGFTGNLVDFVLNQGTGMPIMVIIQQSTFMPRVSIRWDSICMITKGKPTAETDKSNSEVNFESLVEFAKSHDITVPDDIQAMLDTPSEV